ncbi:MAG: HupE/UreJ family protein [Gammaproteobacteria bacterium]|nr:HupE/UreJ family protein [Gammaproteobacteria bacterium]
MTVLLTVLLAPPEPLLAHEVPTDVVIQTMIKPEADELSFLVRVPLEAMRDVIFPQTGPGYLVISEADQLLHDAATIWIAQEVTLYENGGALTDWDIVATRLALPSDRSFESYESALATVTSERLDDSEELHRDQALLDILIRYPIGSAASEFSIAPEFARLGLQTTTVVRYLHVDGAERVYRFSGDPGLLRLDPRWHHAFFRFVGSGIEHILDGVDHLLFVICLLIPFRRIRPLVVIITSFTVAHSITLIASAFGMVPNFLWFPPLIETLIAASIVYMAFENIVGSQWQKRWIIAFGFGLVHGFGFSFALSEIMQFAGGHLLTSLLAFNIGVEIGQLLIILVAVPVINLLFRHVVAERMGTILLSAVLAHSGWHWMSDRASQLAQYSFQWPAMNAAFFAAIIRWIMLLVIIGAILWGLVQLYGRFLRGGSAAELSQSTGSS